MEHTLWDTLASDAAEQAQQTQQTPAAEGTMEAVRGLVEERERLAARILAGEALLLELKARQRQIDERELVTALRTLGVESVGLDDGRTVRIESSTKASLTETTREAGIQWLVEHGHGDVVKREASIPLPKGNKEMSDAVVALVQSLGLTAVVEETVHPQTLQALVRELLRAGAEVPTDTFNVFVVEAAKVTAPKTTKTKTTKTKTR